MKILYFTDISIDGNDGVLNKINQQIDQWVDNSNQIYFLSIENHRTDFSSSFLTRNVEEVKVFSSNILSHLVPNGAKYCFFNKLFNLRKIVRYIDEIKPDLIYLREMLPFPGMGLIFKKYSTLLEANTLLKEELKLYNKFSKIIYNKFSLPLYKEMDGFIGVTDEITNQFCSFNKPSITIGNGIDLNRYGDFKNLTKSFENVNLILVGSPNQPWLGASTFYELASLIPEFNFHLVGPQLDKNDLANFFMYGYLSKDELGLLYKKMHVGVGTLALYKKNMVEACPLKVREYLACGLPVIIAYKDIDLDSLPFVLEIPNRSDSIIENIELIREFVNNMKGNIVERGSIIGLIGIEVKEAKRLHFFKEFS